jgi:hypothetical protein
VCVCVWGCAGKIDTERRSRDKRKAQENGDPDRGSADCITGSTEDHITRGSDVHAWSFSQEEEDGAGGDDAGGEHRCRKFPMPVIHTSSSG